MVRYISILLVLLVPYSVWGTAYYMRADGTAANKAAATSCSAASSAMSIATHNAETFSADDVINLCDDGGEYKTWINAPSSGTEGHPIIYKNADGDTPILDMTSVKATWTQVGETGVYTKATTYTSVLWEDDVPLEQASDANCTDGYWYWDRNGANPTYYKPTSGTPADHTVEVLYYPSFYWWGAINLAKQHYRLRAYF